MDEVIEDLTTDELLWLRNKKKKEELEKEIAELEYEKNVKLSEKQSEIAMIITEYETRIRQKEVEKNGLER